MIKLKKKHAKKATDSPTHPQTPKTRKTFRGLCMAANTFS